MRPFNIELYARSAEEALQRIRDAICCDEHDLREIAGEELKGLRRRYGNNGYWNMRRDQRAAQEASPSREKATGGEA